VGPDGRRGPARAARAGPVGTGRRGRGGLRGLGDRTPHRAAAHHRAPVGGPDGPGDGAAAAGPDQPVSWYTASPSAAWMAPIGPPVVKPSIAASTMSTTA